MIDRLDLHGFRVAFEYKHAEHTGTGQVASRLGIMFCLAISWSLVNDTWPNCWWSFNSSAVDVVVCRSSLSSTTTGLHLSLWISCIGKSIV